MASLSVATMTWVSSRSTFHNLDHAAAVLRRDIDATAPAEDVTITFTHLAYGWRVDDGHHLFRVVEHQPVEEGRVAAVRNDAITT
jgi:hypothetical protein